MRAIILSSIFIIALFSSSSGWGQTSTDLTLQPCNLPTVQGSGTPGPSSNLTVYACSTYSYKADDGTTVVLGEVQNHNDFPILNVKIGIQFLDGNDNIVEYKTGTTLLQVVPPQGTAPFSISSTKPDPSITRISTNIAGFNSAAPRDQLLQISPGLLQVSDKLTLSGTITNSGTATATNTRIYLISFDPFSRVVAIGNTTTSDIGKGVTVNFNISGTPSPRAKSYSIVAESDNYQSKLTDVTNVLVSLPVAISNTVVTDLNGTKYSTIPVGAPVKISSNLEYLASNSQPYVYYVQVKQFGGQVVFIGNSQGVFLGPTDQPSVTWTPDTDGSYYIETYVWNSDKVPLSSAGTRINVVLVK
ncbi:MAG: FxLYD domain-containing protein [Nitrosotalea sp.]